MARRVAGFVRRRGAEQAAHPAARPARRPSLPRALRLRRLHRPASAPPPAVPESARAREAERDSIGSADGRARQAEGYVPTALRTSAGWTWRLIVIGAGIYILLSLVGRVRLVVIPVIAGLLVAALVYPVAARLRAWGVPRLGSAFLAVFGFLILAVGAAVGIGFNAANEIPEVSDQVVEGIDQVREYLADGPLNLTQQQIEDIFEDIRNTVVENRGRLVSGVLSTASVAAEVLAGIVIALFSTFFFVYEGDRIWSWVVGRFPAGAEERVRGAGREAWLTLTGYIRGTVLVALADAVGITIGLIAVGVPLVAPLALLTFLGGFVPIVGATVAGLAAVLVTLVSEGVTDALIIAGVVLAVQQIEGHLLQPLVMRRAVKLHPLAIVIALSVGGILAGIPGAIAAVPFVAIVNRVAGYLASPGNASPGNDVPGAGRRQRAPTTGAVAGKADPARRVG